MLALSSSLYMTGLTTFLRLIYYYVISYALLLVKTNSIGRTWCKMQFEFKIKFSTHNNHSDVPDNTHPMWSFSLCRNRKAPAPFPGAISKFWVSKRFSVPKYQLKKNTVLNTCIWTRVWTRLHLSWMHITYDNNLTICSLFPMKDFPPQKQKRKQKAIATF